MQKHIKLITNEIFPAKYVKIIKPLSICSFSERSANELSFNDTSISFLYKNELTFDIHILANLMLFLLLLCQTKAGDRGDGTIADIKSIIGSNVLVCFICCYPMD